MNSEGHEITEEDETRQPPKKGEQDKLEPEWKDYLAMIIAAFQTVAVPVFLVFGVILVIAILFGLAANLLP